MTARPFDTVVALRVEAYYIAPQVTGHESGPCDFRHRHHPRDPASLAIRRAPAPKKCWLIWAYCAGRTVNGRCYR
ncbi:hypothetical protein KCP74_00725 [Salmonella enterica subsp. enterica]|nr:hypothetical protein KCP74_00725 [Salmonella enterica subsp. enterica]